MKFKLLFALLSSTVFTSAANASGAHAGGHHGDASAIGQPGKASQVTRTIKVDMSDRMRFTPSSLSAKQGETIRFVVNNSGKLKHEMVLGTEKDLKDHYEVMKKSPEMEHADDNMVSLAPGQSGEIIWQFTQSGTIHFACLHPGHYDAGMKGAIRVSGKASASAGHSQPKH